MKKKMTKEPLGAARCRRCAESGRESGFAAALAAAAAAALVLTPLALRTRSSVVYVSIAKIAWVSKIAPKTKRREKGADKRAGSTGKKKKR